MNETASASHSALSPEALYERAVQVMPGGVTASARLISFLKRPLYVSRGEGAYVYDLDGKRYIDHWNSHGASLLGHGHPAVVAAVRSVLERGILCAAETELQVELAERLCRIVPSAEQARFTCSGTETTWHAVRLSRAFTGRTHVIKFEGHFHGINDVLGFSHWPKLDLAGPADAPVAVAESAGIPADSREHLTVVPFNNVTAFERAVETHKSDLAAVVLEPINFDCHGIAPRPGFLQALRAATREVGAVLIFDEILSGFRTGPGGAQALYGVTPDLTTLGKALGGGMPLSAIVGRRDIMQTMTPVGRAVNSGTYNAHLTAIAGGLAFLDVIADPDFYPRLDALGARLYTGLRDVFARRGLPVWVQGVGARFGLVFGVESEPRDYREAARHDLVLTARFCEECLKRGVYFHWVSPHHGFSSAHTLADIDETLSVVDDVAKALA